MLPSCYLTPGGAERGDGRRKTKERWNVARDGQSSAANAQQAARNSGDVPGGPRGDLEREAFFSDFSFFLLSFSHSSCTLSNGRELHLIGVQHRRWRILCVCVRVFIIIILSRLYHCHRHRPP